MSRVRMHACTCARSHQLAGSAVCSHHRSSILQNLRHARDGPWILELLQLMDREGVVHAYETRHRQRPGHVPQLAHVAWAWTWKRSTFTFSSRSTIFSTSVAARMPEGGILVCTGYHQLNNSYRPDDTEHTAAMAVGPRRNHQLYCAYYMAGIRSVLQHAMEQSIGRPPAV